MFLIASVFSVVIGDVNIKMMVLERVCVCYFMYYFVYYFTNFKITVAFLMVLRGLHISTIPLFSRNTQK